MIYICPIKFKTTTTMKTKKIIKKIIWTGNEYIENPNFVKLIINEDLIKDIAIAKELIKKHNFNSIRIDRNINSVLLDIDKKKLSDTDYIADVEYIIVYSYAVHYYAQHKYDCTAQIESEFFNL